MKILLMTLTLLSMFSCKTDMPHIKADAPFIKTECVLFCSGNSGGVVEVPIQENNGPQSKEIKSLLDNNESIQRDLAEQIILRSARTQQTDEFRVFLIKTRRFLLSLLNNPMNKKMLTQLELSVLEMKDFPLAVSDQSYVSPYMNELKVLIKELYLLQGGEAESYAAKFAFSKANANKLTIIQEENSASADQRDKDGVEYIGFDSFKKKNNGTTSIISPAFKLDSVSYDIRFTYLIKFYKADARAQRLIKFFVGEDSENIANIKWEDLNIKLAPDAGSFGDDPTISEKFPLQSSFQNIRVKIEYSSDVDKGFFPALNLFGFDIVEQK